MPMHNMFSCIILSLTHYTTVGCVRITLIHQKLYRAVYWRITTNIFGYTTEKDERLFCYIITHFRGCNGIDDLLTRQARNFIYSMVSDAVKQGTINALPKIMSVFDQTVQGISPEP